MATGAIVVTPIETVVVPAVPLAVRLDGEKVHATPWGAPEHPKVIVPLKAVEFATVMEVVPD
jgi:hypothetical protein